MVMHRVALWSPGEVGTQALRAILARPDMELVAVFSHSAARIGSDVAELTGATDATGILVAGDADSVLAQHPDCVVYTAVGETRPKAAVAELVEILSSGVNAVSSSMMDLIHPASADPRAYGPLASACERGRSTLFTSGIDPGFTGDALPNTALQLCRRVDTVRIQELATYGQHNDPGWALPYGFGLPPGAPAPILGQGVPTRFWASTLYALAGTLEVEIEDMIETVDRRFADDAFDVRLGHMAKGSLVAVRFQVGAVVGGEPRLFVDHVTRMRADIAPDWPAPPAGQAGVHRVEVTGDPSLTLDLHFTGAEGSGHTGDAVIATAARIVNAIPAVIDAAPGVLTASDLRLDSRLLLMNTKGNDN